ncbi:MAG: hypothetical protein ACXADH_11135 [Candidatus Kariarchaeaceae archaeon]
MRTDVYLFVQRCIKGRVELGSYNVVAVKRKHSMWRYTWQRDRAYPLVDYETQEVLTRKAKANRSRLKRQLVAMFEQGIVDTFTITRRKISVTFFDGYVDPQRDQIIPIRITPEPMKAGKKQLEQDQFAGRCLDGCSIYKEQMQQPFMYKQR